MKKYLQIIGIFVFSFVFSGKSFAEDQLTCENVIADGPSIWPPYISTNEKGEKEGVAVDVVKKIFENSNTTLTIGKGSYWTRTLRLLETGQIDIIMALRYTPERQALFDYTLPWAVDEYGIVVKKDRLPELASIDVLRTKKGAVLNGLALPAEFPLDQSEMVQVPDAQALVRVIENDRVDYLSMSLIAIEDFFKIYGLEDAYAMVPNSQVQTKIYMAVSKNTRCAGLLEFLNKQIKELDQ